MTTETKSYTNRSNAVRAAKAALGKDKISDVHFRIVADGDEFTWEEMDLHTGKPVGEPEQPLAGGAAATPQAEARAHVDAITADLPVEAAAIKASRVARGVVVDGHADAKAFGAAVHTAILDGASPAEAIARNVAKRQQDEAAAAAAVAKALPNVAPRHKAGSKPAQLRKGSGALIGVAAGATDGQPHTKMAVEQAVAEARKANGDDPLVVGGIRFPSLTRANEARRLAAEKAAAKAAKRERKATPAAPGPRAAKAAEAEAAAQGKLPTPPAFVTATAKTYQRRLDPIIAAAAAGDVKTLVAQPVDANSKDSRVAAMGRYRDLCVVALKAAAKASKADA